MQHGDLPHDLMEGEEMILDCESGASDSASESSDGGESLSSSVDDECEQGLAVVVKSTTKMLRECFRMRRAMFP